MPTDLCRILNSAVDMAQDTMSRRIDATVAKIPNDARLRDELERTIDDVGEPIVRDALRRILKQLDANADEIQLTLAGVDIHTSLDPIRIVAKDIASGYL